MFLGALGDVPDVHYNKQEDVFAWAEKGGHKWWPCPDKGFTEKRVAVSGLEQ
jgi:hypothetical protein